MSLRNITSAMLIGSLTLIGGHAYPRTEPASANRRTIDFRLKDPRDQRTVSLAELKDKKVIVVVFLGVECPLSNLFLPVLADLHKQYAGKGVAFFGINANAQDGLERVANHARQHAIPFPVLKDVGNKVADQFGARRTPEVFVLDGNGKIVYQGRIDDQFGIGYARPGKPTRRDLAVALEELLAGKPVSVETTTAAGCLIGRVTKPKADGAITYARHVSRILQKNCQECHRPNQIGPMSLLSFEDAVAWSDTIREVVSADRMPPWHADPRYGTFKNDRRLSKEDRETLLTWIDGGTPRGDDKELPPPRLFPADWTIGKPDLIVKMPREYAVPARAPKNGVPYQYFTVDPGFKEDRWVQKAEAKPGAPAVVHHIVVFIVPKGELLNPDAPGAVLCGTAPGDMPLNLEDGFAKKIPAGARLVFQMHYTPNGRPYRDQSSIGLVFAKEKPRHRIFTKPIYNTSFITRFDKIPAGADNYRIEADHVFTEDAHLMHFMPHMHLRGKDFLYEAIYPDSRKEAFPILGASTVGLLGSPQGNGPCLAASALFPERANREVLLSVPHYNFGWQSVYRLAQPKAMPRGTKLHCVAHFDNSSQNPRNPDPAKNVFWGDQTWEEMMIGWIDYFLDDERH